MESETTQKNVLKGYSMLLYFAGSMIMHEPTEECVVDFWKNGILNKLPVRSSNPNFMKAAAQLRESCEDNKICGSRMREDFIRLFGREERPVAPAFESLYINTGTGLLSINTSSVSGFYESYGWESRFKNRIKDDHLGIELLFLTLLIEKYLVLDDEACRREMKKEIRRFINTHIMSWIPDWNDRVQNNATTLCYKGIATLIVACAEDIDSILSQPELKGKIEDLKN